MDMDEKAIEVAKKRFKAENLSFIYEKAPGDVPNEHFDVVILSNVLEHKGTEQAS
jgi:2-polyprenyl-3-methyl-5-hydroxy-6-metoxy-1,4-benzoquinol methylase